MVRRIVQVGALMAALLAALVAGNWAQACGTYIPREKARFHVYVRSLRCGQLSRTGSFNDIDGAINAVEELKRKYPGHKVVMGYSVQANPDQGISRVDVYRQRCYTSIPQVETISTPLSILSVLKEEPAVYGQAAYVVYVSPAGK